MWDWIRFKFDFLTGDWGISIKCSSKQHSKIETGLEFYCPREKKGGKTYNFAIPPCFFQILIPSFFGGNKFHIASSKLHIMIRITILSLRLQPLETWTFSVNFLINEQCGLIHYEFLQALRLQKVDMAKTFHT